MKLKVAYSQILFATDSQLRQTQTDSIIQQSFSGFQRILRRHEKPQLIHAVMLHKPLTEGDVACVDGIEAAAVKTNGCQGGKSKMSANQKRERKGMPWRL